MKKILTILVFTLYTNFTFGQIEKANYRTVADSFETSYNAGNLDKFPPPLNSQQPAQDGMALKHFIFLFSTGNKN